MKIAILSDVHANLRALAAVTAHITAWQPDAVVVAGDTINRGAQPHACLQFVQAQARTAGWQILWGNHEGYVVAHTQPDAPRHGPAFAVSRHSYWTYRQVEQDLSVITALPFATSLTAPDGTEVRVTHASMRNDRDGVSHKTTDDELRRQIGAAPAPPLFCVGHTHIPLIRRVDQTLVFNVGSVGMPFDGDPRASYGQVVWRHGTWHARLVRVAYDREQARRDFFETGFLDGSGPLGYLILDEFDAARPRLGSWSQQYRKAVLAGAVSMEHAVRAFLESL